jgi:ribosome-interacting GTPase 1
MPTNVSPEYKKAEADYRRASDPQERLQCLREMLRTIPKHKGTERLQADIKSKIKQLTEEQTGSRKGGARTGPVQAVHPEGAGQICLLGPPNAGKSSLHARLTGSHAESGPYPYTTRTLLPGMMPFEDVHFQLIDLPPISRDVMEPWIVNALQPADAAMLVVDLSDPGCMDHVVAIRDRLQEKSVTLPAPGVGTARASRPDAAAPAAADAGVPVTSDAIAAAGDDESTELEELSDPFRIHLPTLLVANKSDLDPDPDEVEVLEELLGVRYPAIAVSAQTGRGLADLGAVFFRGLGVVRVYTKAPGKDPDAGRPFTLRQGDTVADLALQIHKEIARSLKFARVWGSGQFDGQQVGPDHRLQDKDIIEIHA